MERVFVALQLFGAVGMSLILVTASLSSSVKRCSTWYSFCVSWIISCISYSLLYIAGTGFGRVPSEKLCIVQTALLYSCPALTACTTLSLLVHGWFNVHFGLSKPPLENYRSIMYNLLFLPYALWLSILVVCLFVGFLNVSPSSRFPLYCAFANPFPAKVSSLFVVIITFSMIPIQVSLGISLSRWCTGGKNNTVSIQGVEMVVRVMIFSILTLVAFAEGIIHILSAYPGSAASILMACLPVSGVLIFGLQRDILHAQIFWKRAQIAI